MFAFTISNSFIFLYVVTPFAPSQKISGRPHTLNSHVLYNSSSITLYEKPKLINKYAFSSQYNHRINFNKTRNLHVCIHVDWISPFKKRNLIRNGILLICSTQMCSLMQIYGHCKLAQREICIMRYLSSIYPKPLMPLSIVV